MNGLRKLDLVNLGPGRSPSQLTRSNTEGLFLAPGGVVEAHNGGAIEYYRDWTYARGPQDAPAPEGEGGETESDPEPLKPGKPAKR